MIFITAISLFGVLLPLNTFGILPIVFVLLHARFKAYMVLPIIFSNTIFNMLISFTSPDFVWHTGIRRMLIAFVAGIIAGVILRVIFFKKHVFKINEIPADFSKPLNIRSMFENVNQNIKLMGFFIIGGVLLNTIFDKYIINNLTSMVFANQYTSNIFHFFEGHNLVNPLYISAINIVYSILDFRTLAAVLVILKPKSFVLYLCYFTLWALLLGSSILL
jgi:uncharacterized membrane protein YraQ (UPF0718 family)